MALRAHESSLNANAERECSTRELNVPTATGCSVRMLEGWMDRRMDHPRRLYGYPVPDDDFRNGSGGQSRRRPCHACQPDRLR